MEESIELKKHSSLIAMSNKSLNVSQRKLYNAILYLAGKQQQTEPNSEFFRIRFSEISKFAGYELSTNTKYLKASIDALVETRVNLNIMNKSNEEWSSFTLISEATIKKYDKFVTIVFPPIIRNNLQYPSIYALLNLSIVNTLSGKYSLQIYELLSDYKKIGKVVIEISKFREIVGVAEGEYQKISNLKLRVIENSILEINQKTDLVVDYELDQRGSGNEYTHIIFLIKDKYHDFNKIEASAYHLLKSKGLPESSSKKFAKQLSKQNIIEAIDNLERAVKKGSVKNSTAYLTKILKNIKIDDEDLHEDRTNLSKPGQQSTLFAPSDYRPIVDDPRNNLDFRKYMANRVSDIISILSIDVFRKFIDEQNSFTIEYHVSKKILDENKNIINLQLLSEDIVFRGWIEKNLLSEEIEYKLFENMKND